MLYTLDILIKHVTVGIRSKWFEKTKQNKKKTLYIEKKQPNVLILVMTAHFYEKSGKALRNPEICYRKSFTQEKYLGS